MNLRIRHANLDQREMLSVLFKGKILLSWIPVTSLGHM